MVTTVERDVNNSVNSPEPLRAPAGRYVFIPMAARSGMRSGRHVSSMVGHRAGRGDPVSDVLVRSCGVPWCPVPVGVSTLQSVVGVCVCMCACTVDLGGPRR